MTIAIEDEFRGCDLGDARRDARLLSLAAAFARDPSRSFPDVFVEDKSGADLEACYRFMNNGRVDPQQILKPHVAATVRRAHEHQRVLCISDTTEARFGGTRPGLPEIQAGQHGHGFLWHCSLLATADGRREPLGILGLNTWTRERNVERPVESARWLAQSIAVEDVVGPGVTIIHVEDREADIYEMFAQRIQRGMHFIVRAQSQRVIEFEENTENIAAFMRAQRRIFERDVVLSRRKGPKAIPKRSRQHTSNAARERRVARLAVAAQSVDLRKPPSRNDVPPTLKLNVVHVAEIEPPDDVEPVEWLLFTTEPVTTPEEIAFVIDSYRARWTIEEYFKALKTGCAYEARQLESYDALLRALSIFAVVAWRLLWLRFLAQNTPNSPAGIFATADELAVLRARDLLEHDTIEQLLKGVARLGGHLKHNGPPGWQVLWRGFRRLADMAEGWALARSDQ